MWGPGLEKKEHLVAEEHSLMVRPHDSFGNAIPERGSIFGRLFGARRRRTPRGQIESEGGVGRVWVRRVLRHLQIGAGRRCSPAACSEIYKKKALGRWIAGSTP